jgi:hypothetical protein
VKFESAAGDKVQLLIERELEVETARNPGMRHYQSSPSIQNGENSEHRKAAYE